MSHSKMFQAWVGLCVTLWVGLLALTAQAQDPSPGSLPRDNGGKRLALVIGNDAYQKVDALKNARNDARLMATTLKKAGFDVTQVNDLGRDGMWSSIDTFKGRINKGDQVVFYYAGHGVQINSNQLLLPIDISAVNDGQVQRDAVSLVDVQDALKDVRFALLVIDACRDNPFPRTAGRSIGGGARGLLPPEPVTGQVIVMSAGRNQRALDSVPGNSQANGLFTWELTQAMQAPGMEIRVALEQVKDRVDDKAKSVGHEQRPGIVSDLRGSFYFFGPTPVVVQGGQSANTGADPESETWTAAERVNTSASYQAYLDSYPKGRYGAAARIAITGLKQPAIQPTTAAPVKPTPLVSNDPETQFWNEAKTSGDREYLDAYAKQYPKGKYLALAQIETETKKLDARDKSEQARAIAETAQREETNVATAERRPKSVRIVYLVSADRAARDDYKKGIEAAAKDLQTWYAKQLDGPTFRLNTPTVEVARSDKDAKWFYSHPNGDSKDDWGYNNGLAEARLLLNAKNVDPQYIWVIYSDGPGDKGRGGMGVAVLPENDLLGLIGKHPKDKDIKRWIAGLGHELGHAFGLAHPRDTDKDRDAIMWMGIYGKYPDMAYLTEEDKGVLMKNPFFFHPDGQPVVKSAKIVEKYAYAGGDFTLYSHEEKLEWVESKAAGSGTARFSETGRDENWIQIFDVSRNMKLRLPVGSGICYWSIDDGKTWHALYQLDKAK